MAKYLKNFRKRIWPDGFLSESHPVRSKDVQEISKILVKTKLLSLVTDDLRHLLGNDVIRRGIFTFYDVFQHKALNKRFLYIIIENLIENLFFNSQVNSTLLPLLFVIPMSNDNMSTHSPLDFMLRLHLSKSYRVKMEWKIIRISENRKLSSSNEFKFASNETEEDRNKNRQNSLIPRSKSLYNEIKC